MFFRVGKLVRHFGRRHQFSFGDVVSVSGVAISRIFGPASCFGADNHSWLARKDVANICFSDGTIDCERNFGVVVRKSYLSEPLVLTLWQMKSPLLNARAMLGKACAKLSRR